MTEVYVEHKDAYGKRKQTISDWFNLSYAKKENDFGSLTIDIRPDTDINLFKIDDKLEIYRKIGAGDPYLELETCWFIRLVRSKIDTTGEESIHILAHDALELADRRIVAYNAQNSYTVKEQAIDNMMKAIMRENFGSLATDTARDISSYLSIANDVSLAPSLKDTFPRQKILPLLQELASKSLDLGTYLAFDIVKMGETGFLFNTYVNQRGIDRGQFSKKSLIFSVENGNVSYSSLAYDYAEERNYIYAGGQGEESERVIQVAYDDARVKLSPLNRREDWIDATSSADPAVVLNAAKKRLTEAGAKVSANLHIQQIEGCQYGLHYGFGDIVCIQHKGTFFDVHIDTIANTVSPSGGEDIVVMARNLDDTEY